MERKEALEKIAWHQLKQTTREEAEEIVRAFFKEPLKPSLREKLNITAIMQWETHTPPANINPGNIIYRPILMDRMADRFRGAANEYLAGYLKTNLGLSVDRVEGDLPDWLACPVCGRRSLSELGTWKTCPVCGWISDPMQEALPDEPIGSNGISLNEARKNFSQLGAISREKLAEVDPDGQKKYPKGVTSDE
jgi:hypothetical protein